MQLILIVYTVLYEILLGHMNITVESMECNDLFEASGANEFWQSIGECDLEFQ